MIIRERQVVKEKVRQGPPLSSAQGRIKNRAHQYSDFSVVSIVPTGQHKLWEQARGWYYTCCYVQCMNPRKIILFRLLNVDFLKSIYRQKDILVNACLKRKSVFGGDHLTCVWIMQAKVTQFLTMVGDVMVSHSTDLGWLLLGVFFLPIRQYDLQWALHAVWFRAWNVVFSCAVRFDPPFPSHIQPIYLSPVFKKGIVDRKRCWEQQAERSKTATVTLYYIFNRPCAGKIGDRFEKWE